MAWNRPGRREPSVGVTCSTDGPAGLMGIPATEDVAQHRGGLLVQPQHPAVRQVRVEHMTMLPWSRVGW